MRFLLDENVHHGLVPFLAGLGHEVTLSPKGLANGAVFAAATSDRRVLITHDKDFSVLPPSVTHPGIILLRILPKDLNQLKVALQRLLTEKPSADLFADRLIVVFPDRHDEFPFRFEVIPFS